MLGPAAYLSYCLKRADKYCSLLLWSDGMDRYTAAADYALNYAGLPTSHQAAAGVTGGGAMRVTTGTGCEVTFPTAGVLTAGNGAHALTYFKINSLAQAQDFMLLSTGAGQWSTLMLEVDGSIFAKRHTDNATLAISPVGVIAINTYYVVEYAAKFNSAVNGGYVKVWVNGNLVINFAGNTISGAVPTAYTKCKIGKNNGGAITADFDDLICWDESGTDFALTQLTTAYLPVIETLAVDANDTVQFTPSAGSNFQNIDETGFHNADTDYNSSATVGHEDLFTCADPATTPAYVFAVAVKAVAKIDVAGLVNLRTKLKSGATTTYSADFALTTAYAMKFLPFGKDPDTAAVWATTAPAAVKIGYKYQS